MGLYHNSIVRKAITEGRTLSLRTSCYLSKERKYVDTVLESYLKELGLDDLHSQISYCVHELAGNANKANTKRIYFQERSLNIDNDDDYEKGMSTFKQDTVDVIQEYKHKQKKAGLFVQFDFQIREDYFKISISNNVKATSQEESRIADKMEKASNYTNIAEAYSVIEDSSEGAGLGIVMMILMLRSLGFGEHTLNVYCKDCITYADVVLKIDDNQGVEFSEEGIA